jgi:hypothetical protein
MEKTKKLVRLAGTLLGITMANELKEMLAADPEGFPAAEALQRRVRDGSLKSFEDLHEVMDANMLGETETVLTVMHADIPPEGDDAKVQLGLDVMNEAIGQVDRWIRDGGLREALDG